MSISKSHSDDDAADRFVTIRFLMDRRDVCDRTIDRWLDNPKLNFPKPQRINGRRYWKLSEILAWEHEREATGPYRSEDAANG